MSLAQGTFLQNMAPAFLVLMGRVKLAWHCGKQPPFFSRKIWSITIHWKQLFQGIISARLFIIWP